MTEPGDQPGPPVGTIEPRAADVLRDMLRSPEYRRLLLFCALLGVPVSLAAYCFLAVLHELGHAAWVDLPERLGWDTPPWWWPLPLLLAAGIIVGLVAIYLPGGGGDVPASGLHIEGPSSAGLPGVVLAALACLPLGAVLGPEAPLIALGGGLAMLFRKLPLAPATPQSTALLAPAGAAAAISAIFGNPLIAAVLLIEGVGGPHLFAVMLPALLASGIGALVFTGLGSWPGLATSHLSLNFFAPFPRLDALDMVWALAIATAIAGVLHGLLAGAQLIGSYVDARPLSRTALCALGAGAFAALYALVTGRSPMDVASSGQATLTALAADPRAWGVGTLLVVLLCKGFAYMLCLGSLRGGLVFPALFLGAAAGVLLASLLGLAVGPAMAVGMAAGTVTTLRLPVSSVVLVSLLLGNAAMIPVVVLAAVVAFVITELLPPRTREDPHSRAHQ